MAQITEQTVLDTLAQIKDGDADIVSKGMVIGVQLKDGHVAFAIQVDPQRGAKAEPLRKQAEEAIFALNGVLSATVVLTAEKGPGEQPRQAPDHGHDHGHGHGHQQPPQAANAPLMPGVRSIIAVASGKGGVGKSTTAVNLALALAAKGLAVGVLDADIYGPSIPRMLGITGQPEPTDNQKLAPMQAHGIKAMSMGVLVDEDTPMIWRGPMAQAALTQLMRDIEWGQLDILVVDMPPGTGDIQLTMCQQVPLTGAVIVSTPQDIALLDARKGMNMFRQVDVPVLGLVENMSYFACPHCGERTEIFSHGGARKEAEATGMEFLGELALDVDIRTTSDGGRPIVMSDPGSVHAKTYMAMADRVWDKVQDVLEKNAMQAPKIVMN